MQQKNYTASFSVAMTAKDAFNRINEVTQWWATDLQGATKQLDDEFTVRFEDLHISTQKITELVPDSKIVWQVTDSQLSFLRDKAEWTNTTIHFDLEQQGDTTEVRFTHVGLVPEVECYTSCSKGWDYFFKGSLFKLLTEGKGTPGLP
jgi:hypothetical protein